MAIGVKTGGRKKNSLNRIPQETRQSITDFINEKIHELFIEYDNLEVKDKISFIKDLLPYAVPKLNATLMQIEEKPTTDKVTKIVFVDYDKTERTLIDLE